MTLTDFNNIVANANKAWANLVLEATYATAFGKECQEKWNLIQKIKMLLYALKCCATPNTTITVDGEELVLVSEKNEKNLRDIIDLLQ